MNTMDDGARFANPRRETPLEQATLLVERMLDAIEGGRTPTDEVRLEAKQWLTRGKTETYVLELTRAEVAHATVWRHRSTTNRLFDPVAKHIGEQLAAHIRVK